MRTSRRNEKSVNALIAVAVLLLALAGALTFKGPANADTANLPVTVTPTSPLTGLNDGDTVSFHIDAQSPPNAAPSSIFGVDARLCVGGTNFSFPSQFSPTQFGLCIGAPLSANSDDFVSVGVAPPQLVADISFRIGVGTSNFNLTDNTPVSISCGPANPCQIVLKLQVPGAVALQQFAIEYAGGLVEQFVIEQLVVDLEQFDQFVQHEQLDIEHQFVDDIVDIEYVIDLEHLVDFEHEHELQHQLEHQHHPLRQHHRTDRERSVELRDQRGVLVVFVVGSGAHGLRRTAQGRRRAVCHRRRNDVGARRPATPAAVAPVTRPSSRRFVRRCGWLLAALAVVVGAAGFGVQPSTSAAQPATGPTVTVTPATGLTDGQAVSITVNTIADTPVFRSIARVCRDGAAYQDSSGNRPAIDFELGGPNCPASDKPISTSADIDVVDALPLDPAHGGPSSDSFLFRVPVGVSTWTDFTTSDEASLSCDDQHPCALVVEVLVGSAGGPPVWKPFVTQLRFGSADPLAGCGGPATDALQTGGSDRMQDAWITWTLAECALPGRHGAASRASFVGEGNAVVGFSNGALDLAYTAGGYDADMKLVEARDPSQPDGGLRPAVAVPIALDATVLAVGGGRRIDDFHKVPFSDVKLTSDEVATLLSGGPSAMSPLLPAVIARNPEYATTEFFDTSAGFVVGGFADAEASSWYATRWLDTASPDAWKVPDTVTFGDDRGHDRGISTELALATPSFNNAITLLSGRPALRRGLLGPGATTSGGIYVLTDLATAKALNLTPVQIADKNGDFIAPTPDTLNAAVPLMHADAQGVLISDPSATVDAGTAKAAPTPAYPLTMVEYALVPLAPLQNDDCSMRTNAQSLLDSWLHYITGAGQQNLPPGLVALPDTLKAQAQTAIAKVGTAAPAIACPQTPPPAAAASSPLDTGSFGGGSGALGSVPNSTSAFGSTRPFNATATPTAASGSPTQTPAAAGDESPTVPAFTGVPSAGTSTAMLALAGIIALTSCAAFVTAGRESRQR